MAESCEVICTVKVIASQFCSCYVQKYAKRCSRTFVQIETYIYCMFVRNSEQLCIGANLFRCVETQVCMHVTIET